jgi:hypothetical protein
MQENKEKRDVVFAVFLIFLGSMFLLNTTGVVGWGIWEFILRFWPIFLILAGIKLILKDSVITEIVLTILAIILFVVIGVFSYISYTTRSLPLIPERVREYILENPNLFFEDGDVDTEEIDSIPFEEDREIEKRNVKIEIGASAFTLNDDSDLEDYFLLSSSFRKGFLEPSLEYSFDDEILNVEFKTVAPRRFVSFWSGSSPKFVMSLGRVELPTDLDVTIGAGKGVINLQEVNVNNIDTVVGAGKLTMRFDNQAVPGTINLDSGAGKAEIILPEDVGFRLEYNLGVGKITVNGESISKVVEGDTVFESENYDNAEIQVTIIANVGVGSLDINNF